MIHKKKWANKKGSALMIAMGMVFLVGATTSSLFYQGLVHSKFGERSLAQTRAMELANSGLELARYTLRHSANDCFSTEIANHTLFDRIPLGEDGNFTVEVLASPDNPYTAKVVSTGTYSPIATTAKVEAKMTCGFLNALDSYAIITAGDLFVTGAITTENGDYSYNEIHADGSVVLFGSVDLPEEGLTITQAGPITTAPPPGVTITQTETPSGMPTVDAGKFTDQMNKFYPEDAAPQYVFHSDGSVTDGANNVLMQAGGQSQTFMGIKYTAAVAGGASKPTWSIIEPGSMESNATFIVKQANLAVSTAVGSELNPKNVTLIVQDGDLNAQQLISLAKRSGAGNVTSRPVGLLVDGNSHIKDLYLNDVAFIGGGTVAVQSVLNLNNGALIAGDDTQLNSVSFENAYDGSPINYHEEEYGNLLKMKGEQTEYKFDGVNQKTTDTTP